MTEKLLYVCVYIYIYIYIYIYEYNEINRASNTSDFGNDIQAIIIHEVCTFDLVFPF